MHFSFAEICTFQKKVVPLQPVSPMHERHVDDHLNISSILAFSEQQESLIAAQQQVTQRVMDNNKILRDSLRQEHDEAERYKQLYEAEVAKNQQLEDRIAQLESRPFNVNGDYVESVNIERYLTYLPSPKRTKRTKLKNNPSDPTLPLWDNNTAISL